MDKEQRTAYLLAQVACMNAELEAMKSRDRADSNGLHHKAAEYEALPVKYGLTHNQVVAFLLEYR